MRNEDNANIKAALLGEIYNFTVNNFSFEIVLSVKIRKCVVKKCIVSIRLYTTYYQINQYTYNVYISFKIQMSATLITYAGIQVNV
jgi:hypothetical protein